MAVGRDDVPSRASWADISDKPTAHKRSLASRHARFKKRYQDGKIDWHGRYVGFAIHPQKTSDISAYVEANTSATVHGNLNTSAPVDAYPEKRQLQEQCRTTSAQVEGFFLSDSEVVDQITALKREKELLSLGNSVLAAKVNALQEQNDLLESRVGQISDLRLENSQLFNFNQQIAQQLQRAEEALSAWIGHALQIEGNTAAKTTPDSISWDDARISAIERAIGEINSRFDTFDPTGLFSRVSMQLKEFQDGNLKNVRELGCSLQKAVSRQIQHLQQQLDCLHSFSSGQHTEDSLESWYEAPLLHSQPVLASESVISAESGPGGDDYAGSLQLHNNVVFDGPVQRDGGNEAGCDQPQNNVVEDRPMQRDHGGNDAGCDQLQNNVVVERLVQRVGGNGSAECHQLQCSLDTVLSRPDGSWAKPPGREFAVGALRIAEFLQVAHQIKAARPHIAGECDKAPLFAICDIDRSVVQMPQLSLLDSLSSEEKAIISMTEAEWEEREKADRQVLAPMYPSGFFDDDGDDVECCSMVPAPSEKPAFGKRVLLRNLRTSHLNGMTGMISDEECKGRFPVLLEDGTTRKFLPDNLQVITSSSLKPTCGSQSQFDSSTVLSEKVGGESDFVSKSQPDNK